MERIKWKWSRVGSGEGWRGAITSGPIFRTMKRLRARLGRPDSLCGCRRLSGTRSAPPYMLCDPGVVTPYRRSPFGSSAVKSHTPEFLSGQPMSSRALSHSDSSSLRHALRVCFFMTPAGPPLLQGWELGSPGLALCWRRRLPGPAHPSPSEAFPAPFSGPELEGRVPGGRASSEVGASIIRWEPSQGGSLGSQDPPCCLPLRVGAWAGMPAPGSASAAGEPGTRGLTSQPPRLQSRLGAVRVRSSPP